MKLARADWLSLLPRPYNRDPKIALVMAPNQARWKLKKYEDMKVSTMTLPTGTEVGLQVVKPKLKTWQEQAEAFAEIGIKIANPHFVGKLSRIPEKYLMYRAYCPLVFRYENMHTEFLNLKRWAMDLTDGDEN